MIRNRMTLLAHMVSMAAVIAGAQLDAQRPPGTDVWIVPMKQTGVAISFGEPRNVTDRPGYDNQPSFTPKGDAVLFTSTDDAGKTDSWRFSVSGGKPVRITNLPLSTYSPTVTPDGKFFSFIRVEPDSTQLLWKLPLDGSGAPAKVLPGVRVGYHVWTGDHTLVVYVLPPRNAPRGAPSTLEIADDRNGKLDTVATNVGRALGKIPGRDAITFQELVKDSLPWITELDLRSRQTRRMVQAPKGADYHVWAPNGALLSAVGAVIYRYTDDGWAPVGDFSKYGVKNISRLAVSPRGNWLAFVADDK